MTDSDILKKAVYKAIENGWKPDLDTGSDEDKERYVLKGKLRVTDFIYNHDFAKALWGDKFINPEIRDDKGSKVIAFQQTAWKHHLRQMVIAEDPIKYLGENL